MQPRKKWHGLVLVAAGVVPAALTTSFTLYETTTLPVLGRKGTFVAMLAFMLWAFWGAAILAYGVTCRAWFTLAIGLCLAAVVFAMFRQIPSDEPWKAYFAAHREDLERTRDRLLTGKQVEVHGRYEVDGRVGAVIEIGCTGTDNCAGYVWSQDGKPPPEGAFHKIVTATPIGNGWYFCRTT